MVQATLKRMMLKPLALFSRSFIVHGYARWYVCLCVLVLVCVRVRVYVRVVFVRACMGAWVRANGVIVTVSIDNYYAVTIFI